MPRLNNATYLDQRARLVTLWELRPGLLAELQSFEQRDLHAFFAMGEGFNDEVALAYRKAASKERPGLPSQAGRAYTHLMKAIRNDKERRAQPAEAPVAATPRKRTGQTVAVSGIARPEVDTRRIARMLVDLSKSPEFDEVLARIENSTR